MIIISQMRQYESKEKHFKQFRIFLILAHSGLIICHLLVTAITEADFKKMKKMRWAQDLNISEDSFSYVEKKEFGMGMAPEVVDEEMLVLLQWTWSIEVIHSDQQDTLPWLSN